MSTDDPLPTTDTRIPNTRTADVAGPTLDGSYRQAPFHFGLKEEGPQCGTMRIGPEVPADREPLRIVSVEPGNQEPPGDPVFRVIDAPEHCEQGGTTQDIGECVGAVLEPPTPSGVEQGCTVFVAFTWVETDHQAELLFEFQATCTDTDSYPCSSPAVVSLRPTEGAPVLTTLRSSVQLTACPEDVNKNNGGNCYSSQ